MSRHDSGAVSSPLSFPVNVARLPHKGMPVRIVADARQLAELAKLHPVERVVSLVADLLVTPWKRNGVKVSGKVIATVVQNCVVTLEPIENRVEEKIDSVFLPDNSRLGREGFDVGGEIVLDADGPDSPELFSGDIIDVGALAEEFFGLGIDLYPRRKGVLDDGDAPKTDDEDEKASSFADKLREALSKK